MSSSLVSNQTTVVEYPSAVAELIAAVRSRLRRYAVTCGALKLIVVAVIVFWLTSAVDAGWFALQRMELPVGLRLLNLVAMTVGGVCLLWHQIVRPLVRKTQRSELALLVERRFPEFQDRLITAVEGQDGYPETGTYVSGMLQRTMDQAAELATGITSDDIFDSAPIRKYGWLAGLLVASVIGFSLVQPRSLTLWWQAFVQCRETYHVRTTALDFTVVAPPDGRRVPFREVDDRLLYLHPRGADVELEMVVPDGHSETGEPWVVPERARVDVIRADGTRSRTYVSATSGSSFRFILTRLQESVSVEVLAGDFRTTRPLWIDAVTPPSVNQMQAECDYPDYTGWDTERDTTVAILGTEVSLPVGTRFTLQAECNKSLQSARIVTDFFEITGDREASRIVPREGYTIESEPGQALVSDDGRQIQCRLRLTLPDVADSGSTAKVAEDSLQTQESGAGDSHLSITSNTSLRFFLHDEDDIVSTAPESLRIRGIADKPPLVAVRTSGVGNSITRRAVIPFEGMITDDYRIESAGFQFIVDDETNWRPRNFRNRFVSGLTYEVEQQGQGERFDVRPLELSEGQTLAVTVVATDGCEFPEAHLSRAEPVVFQIVSNEELLSVLYTRELTLRRRFEEVIRQLEQVRDDLAFHRDVAKRVDGGADDGAVSSEDRIGLTTCATRCGNTLRRQNNELQSIADGFEEIVTQLVNNAIPPQQLAETMRKEIAQPIQAAASGLMQDADRTVSRFRVAAASNQEVESLLTAAENDVVEVVAELKRILVNVRDMAEFHEALSDLKNILEEQQRILKETKRQQIRNLGLD